MPFHFESIPSTQLFLKEQVQSGQTFQHLDYVLADVQTNGIGRMNRAWISDPGNLFVSIWIKEFSLPLTWIPHWVGVTVLGSLGEMGVSPKAIQLKWPNDLVSATRAKIAGILCEKMNEGIIAGIGVNLITAPELSDRETTSVKLIAPAVDYDRANKRLAEHIVAGLRQEPALSELKRRYQEASLLQHGMRLHWLDLHTGQPGEGMFLEYGDFGEVLVRDGLGNVRPLYSEEIKIIL